MFRSFLAPNPSPLTLDGTRTFVLGERRVAVIDPGPNDPAHIETVVAAVASGAVEAVVLLTHQHPDHAAAADVLAGRLGAAVRAIGRATLADRDRIETDSGEIIALHTPGHTEDHAAFHWPAERAVFCGDLMMGGLDTALVAPPEGHLGRYLASLERLRALAPRVIHPAHGPSFDRPAQAIDAYIGHREDRARQVMRALERGPLDAAAVAEAVYGGTIPVELRSVAVGAALAYLEHLARAGRVREHTGRWQLASG